MTTNYKLIKTTERKYYKYVDSPWTQPVFTSNTTWGTVSADSYTSQYQPSQYPWQALDGYTSGGDNHDFASSGSSTVNWYWDFAYPLKISSIQMWNRGNAENYGGAETYTIYGKNSDDSYEQIGTLSLAAVGWISGSTNISSAKQYYGLKINCAGTKSYAGIGEILLTATTETVEPGTAQDYDYYEDVDVYKAIKAIAGRNYYKYKEVAAGYRELTALTSNGTGTLDTGFYPSSNTKIRAKAIYSHYAGSYFFGHSSGTESNSFRFMRAGDTTYLDYGSGDRYNRIQGTYFTSTTEAYEFEIGNRYVKDIPTDTIKISGSAVSFSTKSYTIKIFGVSYDYGTLNYMQILENDVLERDFVPCLDVTNDVVGLYDKVNDVFYQSPSGWTGGDYVVEDGTAQDYDFYEDVYSYKAIKKAEVTPPAPTVRLMARDPNNPTSFTVDTGYSFGGSSYSPHIVGSYAYQLSMRFDQSDNVEYITFTTSFSDSSTHPGYYDNSGNWHNLSFNSGTLNVSTLTDFDYSRGISFGVSFSGSYATS